MYRLPFTFSRPLKRILQWRFTLGPNTLYGLAKWGAMMNQVLFSVLLVIQAISPPAFGIRNIADTTNANCLTTKDMESKSHLDYSIIGATKNESWLIQKTVDTFMAHNTNNLENVIRGATFKIVDGLKTKKKKPAAGLTNVRKKLIRFDRKALIDPHFAVGIIAHEVCHLFSKMPISGEHKNLYMAYENSVPLDEGQCTPSRYAKVTYTISTGQVSRIEELAEICSAHLFAPDFVAKNWKKSCKKADHFMKSLFRAPVPACNPVRKS